jgi:hypothetical protein
VTVLYPLGKVVTGAVLQWPVASVMAVAMVFTPRTWMVLPGSAIPAMTVPALVVVAISCDGMVM